MYNAQYSNKEDGLAFDARSRMDTIGNTTRCHCQAYNPDSLSPKLVAMISCGYTQECYYYKFKTGQMEIVVNVESHDATFSFLSRRFRAKYSRPEVPRPWLMGTVHIT